MLYWFTTTQTENSSVVWKAGWKTDELLQIVRMLYCENFLFWPREQTYIISVLFFHQFIWLLQQWEYLEITFWCLFCQGDKDELLTYVTACVRFALVTVSFVACLFADASSGQHALPADQPDDDIPAKPCPKLSASFLSVVFFWWFTRWVSSCVTWLLYSLWQLMCSVLLIYNCFQFLFNWRGFLDNRRRNCHPLEPAGSTAS